jgi:Flp pilus assembly secretin CpaC
VAGLLNNRIVASKDVTPLLGDLPIIGALFRSVRYEKSETELVVIVTPRLVSPLNPGQVGELPGDSGRTRRSCSCSSTRRSGTVGDRTAAGAKGKGTKAAAADEATARRRRASGEPVRFRGAYGFVPATN